MQLIILALGGSNCYLVSKRERRPIDKREHLSQIPATGVSGTLDEDPTIPAGRIFPGAEDAEYVSSVLTGCGEGTVMQVTRNVLNRFLD